MKLAMAMVLAICLAGCAVGGPHTPMSPEDRMMAMEMLSAQHAQNLRWQDQQTQSLKDADNDLATWKMQSRMHMIDGQN